MIKHYRFTLQFYCYSTIIAWVSWGLAAFLSHQPSTLGYEALISFLSLMGLCGPLAVALHFSLSNNTIFRDVFSRITNIDLSNVVYLIVSILLMPASILLAMAISILFGYDASQFDITRQASFSSGVLPVWFILAMAPILEELAWHSYGTDCLRRRYSLFATSLIFAIYWAIWHMPLAFIKDYYHSNLVLEGVIYSGNFFLSLLPFVLLMNWLYYKSNRNILVAVFLHLGANIFNEIFATHPDSKIIQTVLLSALAIFLVVSQKSYFFDRRTVDEPVKPTSVNKPVTL